MSEVGGRFSGNVGVELVEELETKTKTIQYRLKRIESGSFYVTVFDGKLEHDYLMYHDDLEFMKKVIRFMVQSYNEGVIDGKNHALMFMQ